MPSERQVYLDNLCGLLMIKIIFFVHVRCAALIHTGILIWLSDLLCFSMAWFFFKSGMFHRDVPFRDRVKKDAKALLIPYISFTLFAFLLYIGYEAGVKGESLHGLFVKSAKEIILGEAIQWNLALWFLPSLFAVKAIANLVMKKAGGLPVFLVSITAAFLFNHFQVDTPVFLGNIALGLTFYALGYLLRDIQFKDSVFFPALGLFAAGVIVHVCKDFVFRVNYVDPGDIYLVDIAFALTGIIVFNNLFKRFLNKEIPLLYQFGMLSFVPFCIHYPFTMLFPRFLNHLPVPVTPTVSWVVQSLLMIPLFIISIRFFNTKGKVFLGK